MKRLIIVFSLILGLVIIYLSCSVQHLQVAVADEVPSEMEDWRQSSPKILTKAFLRDSIPNWINVDESRRVDLNTEGTSFVNIDAEKYRIHPLIIEPKKTANFIYLIAINRFDSTGMIGFKYNYDKRYLRILGLEVDF